MIITLVNDYYYCYYYFILGTACLNISIKKTLDIFIFFCVGVLTTLLRTGFHICVSPLGVALSLYQISKTLNTLYR